MASTRRFLTEYFRPDDHRVTIADAWYERGDGRLPASIYRPRETRGPVPGWVVLHGLTRTGRAHPSLVRFARAFAAAGSLVLVPEIPEWRDLRVAPAVTIETIRAAVRALQSRDDVAHDRAGLFGFSFGATQALIAAADPGVQALLRGIAAWGGYHNPYTLFDFAVTGEAEAEGAHVRTAPDPYGIWIMAGNYLTAIPGHENDGDVAHAVHSLALEAGETHIYAGDPRMDAAKLRLRDTLAPGKRELFDLLAPPTSQPRSDIAGARAFARSLADAARRVDPLMDPRPFLPRARVRTLLAHGRDDRLVPFTETLQLARALPAGVLAGVTITSLFAHSGGTTPGLGPVGIAREAARFVLLLHRIMRLV